MLKFLFAGDTVGTGPKTTFRMPVTESRLRKTHLRRKFPWEPVTPCNTASVLEAGETESWTNDRHARRVAHFGLARRSA